MGRWLRIFVKWLVPLCATVLVGVALWRAQYPGVLVERGVQISPTTFRETTKHGWPAFSVLRHVDRVFRIIGGSLPRSVQIHYSVLSWNMAVDLAAWIAVVIATARLSWRTLTCRGQFSLRVLFSLTTAVAIFLAWWRLEQNAFYFAGVFRDPETPLLRMLRFPPDVYIPLLFGTGCLILCTIDMTIYVLAPAQTIAHDLLTRTANTSPTRKRG